MTMLSMPLQQQRTDAHGDASSTNFCDTQGALVHTTLQLDSSCRYITPIAVGNVCLLLGVWVLYRALHAAHSHQL